ncbi:serine hydrolase [Robiginitalea sp. M366]|uniref:serine hydrolase domain-containing protein n=1 Tax=Robiginitalea aestuariiviva TaxID=3036903 RepID=UPI00240DBDE6|nr:serine hydrolase [Robiginitalea aestuariiviva]MDG1572932.1 serine hydrolase [Robiginitalea aestuariiviva]
MKRLKVAGGLAVVILLVLGGMQYPKLTIISGYASKYMASAAFVGGMPPDSVLAQDFQVPLISLAKAGYMRETHMAEASVFGLQQREAFCREGLGCALRLEGVAPANDGLRPNRYREKVPLPYPMGHLPPKDTVFPEVDYTRVQAAIDQAFSLPEQQRTRTLLILYKGHILGERYAAGFGPDTPILGWSMTKSVLATLYGILEYQGRLRLTDPAGLQGWAGDERARITFEDLLRMQSGLEWDENYNDLSDVTRMLFLSADMSQVQAGKPAVASPGEVWNYSSGTTNLLSGLLGQQLGSKQEYLDFPYRELIDRIGMHSMLVETDLSGHFVGSSYGWASTRDWARFGMLYLNRGNWNGTQVFDPGWAARVAQPTAASQREYGLHFWLNASGVYPDAPADLYSANGYQGQHVFIIPSKSLVVVRTGLAEAPDFDANAVLRELVAAIGE